MNGTIYFFGRIAVNGVVFKINSFEGLNRWLFYIIAAFTGSLIYLIVRRRFLAF